MRIWPGPARPQTNRGGFILSPATRQSSLWAAIGLLAVILLINSLYYQSSALLASTLLTFLYIHLYSLIEDGYFGRLARDQSRDGRLVHWLILAHRLVLLLIFVFFESLFLTQWDLHPPSEGGLIGHFWLPHLMLLVWALRPSTEVKLALGHRSKLISLLFVILAMILANFVHAWGEQPAAHPILQDATFAIVAAISLGAIVALYDRFIKWLTGRFKRHHRTDSRPD